MKVIIPLTEEAGLKSPMSEHFGSAPFYGIADTERSSVEIIPNSYMHHDHGQCTPADFFAELGVDVLLCNGIGARAANKLQAMNIEIYMADMAPTLEEALARFGQGTLSKVSPQQACQGHDCH